MTEELKEIRISALSIWYVDGEKKPEIQSVFYKATPHAQAVDILPAIRLLDAEWKVQGLIKDFLPKPA